MFMYETSDFVRTPVDGRTLIDHARVETQNHRFTYDEVSFAAWRPAERVCDVVADECNSRWVLRR
jgi:20S proteasome alpha/beta subunit